MNKLTTGISGLDRILDGGMPELSICIVAGPPGTGKTVLTQQIVHANASPNCKVLCLTALSEPPMKLLRYMQKFRFFDPDNVGSNIIYLDIGETLLEKGLEGALAAIVEYVEVHQPAIVTMEGFKAVHDMTRGQAEERKFGYELAVRLAAWGVTAFLVGEYTPAEMEIEPIFAIADAIIRMQSQLQGVHYQRYVDVTKLRGEAYFRGLHPFTIGATGLSVYPRIRTPEVFVDYTPRTERVSTGLVRLDEMLQGGFPAGTVTMVAGSSGTGKTLFGLHFLIAGAMRDEPGVIVTMQENPVQLRGVAAGFGWDLQELEAQGKLVHLYHSPVEMQPDIHAELIKEAVRSVGARRIFIDLLGDIELATPDKVRYKDYIYSLVYAFRVQGITAILASELPQLLGPLHLGELGISFITDNVILLRYMELFGRMGRAISVMKVRGSPHSKGIREYEITAEGLCIGAPIEGMAGVMAGTPILREGGPLRDLPSRARYVVEAMTQPGGSTLPQLEHETGLHRDRLEEELGILQQQGLVLALNRDDGVYYRTTM